MVRHLFKRGWFCVKCYCKAHSTGHISFLILVVLTSGAPFKGVFIVVVSAAVWVRIPIYPLADERGKVSSSNGAACLSKVRG